MMAAEINVKPGDVLALRAGDRKWFPEPMRLQVARVRDDLNRYYDDFVWIEGYELDSQGNAVRWTQELVKITALRR